MREVELTHHGVNPGDDASGGITAGEPVPRHHLEPISNANHM